MARVLMKGNEALSEAAIRAGLQAFYGYPITPQNEVPGYMAEHLPLRGGVPQAESRGSHQHDLWCCEAGASDVIIRQD